MNTRSFLILLLFAINLPLKSVNADGQWETLKNCKLLDNEYFDGDSFHVKTEKGEFIFRLYFADTPESDDSELKRVEDQAKHFGISAEKAIKAGEEAKAFTKKKLCKPFVVKTKWAKAMGRSKMQRFYALVELDNKDYAEMLVEEGLARAFGEAPDNLPNGKDGQSFAKSLLGKEKSAKSRGAGAWKYSNTTGTKPVVNLPSGFRPAPLLPQQNPIEKSSASPAPRKPLSFEQKQMLEAQLRMGQITEQEYRQKLGQ